jgi:zinc transporter 2
VLASPSCLISSIVWPYFSSFAGPGFAISLFALWAVSWRATRRHSFGYQRVEILGALASILMTWVITAFIVFEAVNRSGLRQEPLQWGRLRVSLHCSGLLPR